MFLSQKFSFTDNAIGFIRLFLALIVVIFHCSIFIPSFKTESLLLNGYFAVDSFFILSGFLITASYQKNKLLPFLIKRCKRIFPGYWVCLLICVCVFYPLSVLVNGFSFYPLEAIAYLENNFLLIINQPTITGLFQQVGHFNGSIWTLSYEFACYLFTPIIVSLFKYSRKLTIILFIFSLIALLILIPEHYNNYSHSLIRLFPFYFSGSLLYFYLNKIKWNFNLFLLSPFLLSIIYSDQDYNFYFLAPIILPYLLIGLSILLPYKNIEKGIGDYSYGIYLYHLPVLSILFLIGFTNIFCLFGTGIIISGIIARWSYFNIEKPSLTNKFILLKI